MELVKSLFESFIFFTRPTSLMEAQWIAFSSYHLAAFEDYLLRPEMKSPRGQDVFLEDPSTAGQYGIFFEIVR
jgi:hypothetical protein